MTRRLRRWAWRLRFLTRRLITGRWRYRHLDDLDRAIQRAGDRLEIPDQLRSSSDLNHWNDAELRRALHERAVFPELEANNDHGQQFADRWLRQQLAGDDDDC